MIIMYILYKQLVDVKIPGFKPNHEIVTKYVQNLRNVVDPNRGFME